MSVLFTFIHSFLLCGVLLARNISEVNIINLLPFLIDTVSTYLLFLLRIFLGTITNESTGTVSAKLMILLSDLYSLMGSGGYLCSVLISAFVFAYSFLMTIFSRKHAYIVLGRGGTPATWFGYISITVLDFFCINKTISMASTGTGTSYLSSLPQRTGPRPNVVGIAPSRQEDCIPAISPIATHSDFVSELHALAATHLSKFLIQDSFLEGAIPTLFALQPTSPSFAEFGNEIGHPHEKDGSMHLVMHPADTATVINAGWGERHPLCANNKKWWVDWHHAHGDRPCAPGSLVLVWAPVNAEHKVVVMKCVRAAGVEMVEDGE